MNDQQPKKTPLTISLEPDIVKELERVARDNFRSRANQIRIFIIEGLARARGNQDDPPSVYHVGGIDVE